MKTIVTVNTDLLDVQDMKRCNKKVNEFDIEFQILETNNFLSSGLILILIEIAQNVGYNAIYDILKYSLFSVISVISDKAHKNDLHSKSKITISINNNTFSLNCNFPLTDSQKEKVIDAAIEKFKEMEVNT